MTALTERVSIAGKRLRKETKKSMEKNVKQKKMKITISAVEWNQIFV